MFKTIKKSVFLTLDSNSGSVIVPSGEHNAVERVLLNEYTISATASELNDIYIIEFDRMTTHTVHATPTNAGNKANISGFPLTFVNQRNTNQTSYVYHVIYDTPRMLEERRYNNFQHLKWKVKYTDGTLVPNANFNAIYLLFTFETKVKVHETTHHLKHRTYADPTFNIHRDGLRAAAVTGNPVAKVAQQYDFHYLGPPPFGDK